MGSVDLEGRVVDGLLWGTHWEAGGRGEAGEERSAWGCEVRCAGERRGLGRRRESATQKTAFGVCCGSGQMQRRRDIIEVIWIPTWTMALRRTERATESLHQSVARLDDSLIFRERHAGLQESTAKNNRAGD